MASQVANGSSLRPEKPAQTPLGRQNENCWRAQVRKNSR
jgi:hypothetical protein